MIVIWQVVVHVRSSSLFMTRDFNGLLTGLKKPMNDITSFNEMYYTKNLDFKQCREEFYKEDDILWRRFMDDIKPDENPAEVLSNIYNKSRNFVSSNEIHGRGKEMKTIKQISQGDIMVLTGGVSLGKSFIARRFFDNQSNCLYLDGSQTGPDIVQAMIIGLLERGLPSFTEGECRKIARMFNSIIPALSIPLDLTEKRNKDFLPQIFLKIAKSIDINPERSLACLQIILEIMSELNSPIDCFIFDAADSTYCKTRTSLRYLDCLTALSKTYQKISFIMATSTSSSSSSFLTKIGYNINHISHVLFVGDVSPIDMFQLLSSWGIRPSLAFLLIEIYGGHILQITRALTDLHHHHQKADIDHNFIFGLSCQLKSCIKECNEQKIDKDVMRTLMKTGFFPCKSTDQIVEIFTKHDVGRFISDSAIAPCLSNELRRHKSGIIPSTQMIRIFYSLSLPYL